MSLTQDDRPQSSVSNRRPSGESTRNRLAVWFMPDGIVRRTLVFAWLSLATEIAIVGTGGAVRLTGSGLGCPTWPTCTPGSLVPTAELGLHGAIEFGNRLMTGVVGIVAVIMLLMVLRLRSQRPDLFRLALLLVIGVVVQAALGGITVLTGLNSYIVGAHYFVSATLVSLAAWLVFNLHYRPRLVPEGVRWYRWLTGATALFVVITVAMGVLTTGAGPHSGDADTPRNGFNAEIWDHLHSYPGYILLALIIALIVASHSLGRSLVLRYAYTLLAVTLVQVVIGVIQARTGLPGLLVGIHMVLACLAVAALTATVLAVVGRGPEKLRPADSMPE